MIPAARPTRPAQDEERGSMEMAVGIILIVISLIEIFGVIRVVGQNSLR
jgi:hypothetical protein